MCMYSNVRLCFRVRVCVSTCVSGCESCAVVISLSIVL